MSDKQRDQDLIARGRELAPRCGVFNPGGVPCTKWAGHPAGHDPASYGVRVHSSEVKVDAEDKNSGQGGIEPSSLAVGEGKTVAPPLASDDDGKVFYPGIVDQKTLSACLGTAEQIMREPRDDRIARFHHTKGKLIAQIKAHPLSFDEWNSGASRPLAQWQPIETAPKDGTRILAWSPEMKDALSLYWDAQFSNEWNVEQNDLVYSGAWTDNAVHSFSYEEVKSYAPTVWMPLPPAPGEPENQEDKNHDEG